MANNTSNGDRRTLRTDPRRPRGRRLLAATAGVVAALTLGACSNGFEAQTDQIYQPGPGISVREGGVYLLNGAFVSDGQGHATLIGALLNQQKTPDRLLTVGVTDSKGRPANASILPGTIALPPKVSVQLSETGPIRADGVGLAPGTFCTIDLTFQNAAPIKVQIPVLTRGRDFGGVPIAPIPTTSSPTPQG